ncbi:Cilia- and flagella-associated protein [Schistosoma japonicum]|nr:Cilia- and flagella-associated protein [Schistosoma japonicum]
MKDISQSNSQTIRIHLQRIINFVRPEDGNKYSAKLEHNDVSFGESQKCDPNSDNELIFNHDFKSVTIYEHKVKDKKHKEAKTEIWGQTTFDGLPLVKNSTEYKMNLKLFSQFPTTLDDLPIAEVTVSTDQPLLSDEFFDELNILYINIKSLQNVPETFHSKDHYTFVAALPMIDAADKNAEKAVVSNNGFLMSPSDAEYISTSFRWPTSGSARSFADIMQNNLSDDFLPLYKKEDGDFPLAQFSALRDSANSIKTKVVWNQQHRRLFKERISTYKFLPVEVFCLQSSSSGRKKKEEGLSYNYHGVAYVNLTPLLYPGVEDIRGAYKIYPFNQKEYEEKTKRQNSLLQDVLAKIRSQSTPTIQTDKKKTQLNVPKNERKTSFTGAKVVERSEIEKQKSNLTPNTEHEQVIDQVQNTEAQQYLDAQSFIMLEFRLEKPLIKKRTLEEIDQKISMYITEKQPVVKRHVTAEKAVNEYHKQIAEVANYLLMEFKVLFADLIQTDQLPVDHEYAEQMKHELYYSLNSSGKYFAFKERLKFAVIKIVREKFFRTKPFTDQEQLHLFLRDLFVYLVDEMHIGLKKVFCARDFTKTPEPNFRDPQTLLLYAREAEQNQMYDWAVKYYQERIARNPGSSACWLDLGVYYLGRNDLEQAATCIHRSLTIDPKHSTGLILFGLVSSMQNCNEEATDFLEAAVNHDPKNPIVWVILGLFYETISNDIGVDMALDEAKRLDEGDEQEVVCTPKSETNDNLITNKCQSSNMLSEGSQSDELINKPSKESTNDEILNENVDNFKIIINELDKESNPSTTVDGIKTDVDRINEIKIRKSRHPKVPKSGIKMSTHVPCESAMIPSTVFNKPLRKSLFIRTAEFLLDRNMYSFASMALAHELIAQKKELEHQSITCDSQMLSSNSISNLQVQTDNHTPIQTKSSTDNQIPGKFSTPGVSTITNRISSTNILFQRASEYHLLCARLAMNSYKQDLPEAEFNASLVIEANPESIEAWACLGHLRYISGDLTAARSCFERCLALVTWPPKDQHILLLRLGSIYLQEQKYHEAKDIYLRACKNCPTCETWLGVGKACYRLEELDDAEEALSEANYINNRNPEVWAYLSMICLKTNRRTEAEQSFKYCIQMKLNDTSLLNEIHSLQMEVGWGNPLAYWVTSYSQ